MTRVVLGVGPVLVSTVVPFWVDIHTYATRCLAASRRKSGQVDLVPRVHLTTFVLCALRRCAWRKVPLLRVFGGVACAGSGCGASFRTENIPSRDRVQLT